jgi:predicted nuclease of predicted toxin-antitoxin system
MARLLANENVPRAAVTALRDAGHDVAWAAEDFPTTLDADVLAHAVADGRVLVTLDKDFGDLAIRRGLPASSGIVLVRLPPRPDVIARVLVRLFEDAACGVGKLVVVEDGRVRERPLARGA